MIQEVRKACYTCRYPNPHEDRWTGKYWAIGCDAPNQEGIKLGWWFEHDQDGNEIMRECPCWGPIEEVRQMTIDDLLGGNN